LFSIKLHQNAFIVHFVIFFQKNQANVRIFFDPAAFSKKNLFCNEKQLDYNKKVVFSFLYS